MIYSASNRCEGCVTNCPVNRIGYPVFCVQDDAGSLISRFKTALTNFERDAIGHKDYPEYERVMINYAKEMLRLAQARLRGLPLYLEERKDHRRRFHRTMDKGYFGPHEFARYGYYAATMPDAWADMLQRNHPDLHEELTNLIDKCISFLMEADTHYNGSLIVVRKRRKARANPSFS